jgi:hypothetical protein
MDAPGTISRKSRDFHTLPGGRKEEDWVRSCALILIAVVAFVTGLMIGQLSETVRNDSRIQWPSPTPVEPRPRALQP